MCRHITRKFYRKLLRSSHWQIQRRTVAHATDCRMHRSHQVRISVILNIRAHTTEPTTGRHKCDGPSSGNRRVINEFYLTRPSRTLFKIWPFILPTPLFSTSTLPLTDHCSQNPPKPYTYHPLLGVAAVGVYLANWIILHLFFSPFPRYVSLNLYSFILHFGLVVSINLVLSRILFPLYDYV